MVSALNTWSSEKCAVRLAPGSGMPWAAVLKCAAGLCAYRNAASSAPGTLLRGASGTTVIRTGSAARCPVELW